MWDQIKWYLINVGLKKYAPIGAMAALATLGTFMAAHAGMLEQWGITYGVWPLHWPTPPTGAVIVVELDTLSKAAIAAITTIVAVAFRAAEHHTLGTPVVPGGARATDPPAPETPIDTVAH